MAPFADAVVDHRLPGVLVIDPDAAIAYFHHEFGRRVRVEGYDPVVRMLAQRQSDGDAGGLHTFIRPLDILQLTHLQLEMMEFALSSQPLGEGDGMMARAGMQERGMHRAAIGHWLVDIIGKLREQRLAHELLVALVVFRVEGDVADALVARHETMRDLVRNAREARIFQTERDLVPGSDRPDEMEKPVHLPQPGGGLVAILRGNTKALEV